MSLDDWCKDELIENEAAARRLSEAEARREERRDFAVMVVAAVVALFAIFGLVFATGLFFKWMNDTAPARDAAARAEGWRMECRV